MYKLCYYRFGAVYTEHVSVLTNSNKSGEFKSEKLQGRPTGYDRVRHTEIGNKNIEFEHLEEAYTTEHWIVRIYRVLKPSNRGR
jgi:dolichyl-diphosphooligosaccharide--protein glycosyltransferase